MIKKFISLLLLICVPHFSVASNWESITHGQKSTVSIDYDSIAPVDSYWKVWVKTQYEEAQQTSTYPKKSYRSVKYLQYTDCKGVRSTIVRWIAYDEDGNVVEQINDVFNAKNLNDPVPDTVGEDVVTYVCAYASKAKKLNDGFRDFKNQKLQK
jgi:hypothetical protein